MPCPRDLTQIKCYRGWEVDEGSADTLTHIHGYRRPDYEFDLQTRKYLTKIHGRYQRAGQPHKVAFSTSFA